MTKVQDPEHSRKEEKAKEVIKRLRKLYPNPKTALDFSTPLELLIATMLSAQATDKLVNTVTPALFERYKTAQDFARASVEEIDTMIKKVNFHVNKSKNIKAAAQMIVEKHNGQVPQTMQELDDLPGVARKTANVVMSGAFGKAEGITVDTHVMRLSTRLALTDKKDPEKIEQDLMQIVPREDWKDFPHLLILYGREYAPARPKRDGPIDILTDLYV
jgi:endonuclease III